MQRFTDSVVTVLRFLLIALICAVWFLGLALLAGLVLIGWGRDKARDIWRASSFMTLLHELR